MEVHVHFNHVWLANLAGVNRNRFQEKSEIFTIRLLLHRRRGKPSPSAFSRLDGEASHHHGDMLHAVKTPCSTGNITCLLLLLLVLSTQ